MALGRTSEKSILPIISVFIIIYVFAMDIFARVHGFSIMMISRDSIESPLFPLNMTLEDRHQRIAELSVVRHSHLSSYTSSSRNHSKLNIHLNFSLIQPPLSRALSNFYILNTVVGTQLYSPYLSVDLSHDDTWMQCEGCKRCFRLRPGNFKFKKSRSFRPLPCNHPLCVPKKCQGTTCLYEARYVSGTSEGFVGIETFTFPAANRVPRTFRDLAFGCGLKNAISFGQNDGSHNVIAGIFGLGKGPRSFLTQLGQYTNGRFSYCLPPWTSRQGTSTILYFGNEAQIRGRVQTTPLLQGVPRYHLRVSGVSVRGTRLAIDPTLFRMRAGGTGGFIIDPGVGHTLLVSTAYSAVKAAMVQYFRQYNMIPAGRLNRLYDLCYARPTRNVALPTMTIHFEGGANLNLNNRAVFEDFGYGFCMIIMAIAGPGPNVLGAFQQANHRFLFDTRASTLSFVPETC